MKVSKQLPGWLIASWNYSKDGDEVTISDVSIFRFRPKSKHKIGRRLTKIIGKQFDKISLRPIELQLMPNKDFSPQFPEGINFAVK